MAPFVVPLITTVTPIKGSPVASSITVPLIIPFCAKAEILKIKRTPIKNCFTNCLIKIKFIKQNPPDLTDGLCGHIYNMSYSPISAKAPALPANVHAKSLAAGPPTVLALAFTEVRIPLSTPAKISAASAAPAPEARVYSQAL